MSAHALALSFLLGILRMLHLSLSFLFLYASRATRIMVRNPRVTQETEGELLSASYYPGWSVAASLLYIGDNSPLRRDKS